MPSHLLRRCLIAACIALPFTMAVADESAYPTRPITVVVPYAAGGAADNMARVVAAKLGEQLSTSVVVQNFGGGSGVVGAQKVLRSEADGYTLLYGTSSDMIVSPLTIDAAGYQPESFTPISQVGYTAMALAVHPASGLESLAVFIERAKSVRQPLTLGVTGIASLQALAAAMLIEATGIEVTVVPYRGGALMMNDLLGQQIDAAIVALPGVLGAHQTGQLKALAVLSAARATAAPDVPTVNETLPQGGVDVGIWAGLAGPANLPEPIVERLNRALSAIKQDPDFVKSQLASGSNPVAPQEPAQFKDRIAAEKARFAQLVGLLGAFQ
ncbi:MAG: tripartite tricarboxylate transporter substrate binding protein [Pigmentiphaga sp.]|nr:tripartite tricarboxylate transporter substrate binding protein [Pigmentiphaga sp.]